MHLGRLDHTLLNKTACFAHRLFKFYAIHGICSDNGSKQISGSAAFLENTVRPDHPGFPALFIHEVRNELSLWDSGNDNLLWPLICQVLCHKKQLLPRPSMIPVGHIR